MFGFKIELVSRRQPATLLLRLRLGVFLAL